MGRLEIDIVRTIRNYEVWAVRMARRRTVSSAHSGAAADLAWGLRRCVRWWRLPMLGVRALFLRGSEPPC
jgi:hypothetical protein